MTDATPNPHIGNDATNRFDTGNKPIADLYGSVTDMPERSQCAHCAQHLASEQEWHVALQKIADTRYDARTGDEFGIDALIQIIGEEKAVLKEKLGRLLISAAVLKDVAEAEAESASSCDCSTCLHGPKPLVCIPCIGCCPSSNKWEPKEAETESADQKDGDK